MEKIWLIIPGFENYEVSNTGLIRNKVTGLLLKSSSKNKYHHQIVGLYKNGKHYNRSVHVMVLLAFRGLPAKGSQTRHLDGNPRNNALSNLAYGTHAQNTEDRVLHGTNKPGSSNGNSKLTNDDIITIRNASLAGQSQRKIASIFNISQTNVKDIINRKTWKHI